MLYPFNLAAQDSLKTRSKRIRGSSGTPDIKTKTTLLSAAIATTLFLAGCSDNGDSDVEPGTNPNTQIGTNNNAAGDGNTSRGLIGFENRAAFETTLKDALRNYYSNNGFFGGGDSAIEVDVGAPADPQTAPVVLEAEVSNSTSSTETSSGDDSASDGIASSFTDTNVQEAGVDEADRVKSDGRYLYVLGNAQYGGIDTPDVIAIDSPVITLDTGDGLVDLSEDTSQFYEPNSARLRILEMNSDAADATLLHDSTIELGGQSVDGMYLHGANRDALILTSTSHAGGYWDYWGYPGFWGTTSSSIHRLSVEDRNSPNVVESANFDGQIISSRVVGDHMYLAARYSPVIDGLVFEDPNVSIDAVIDSIDIDSVMPSYQLSDGSSLPLASSDNCFVSSMPDNGYYLPDIVTLAAINLNDLSISDSVCYLGSVETLYVSTEAAVIANTFYDYSGSVAEPDFGPGGLPPVNLARTSIHQFSLDNGQLAYAGSGTVDGYVSGSNQQRSFRFSHANDYLRVVTENEFRFSFGGPSDFLSEHEYSPVFVSVLKPDGSGRLDVVAKLPNDAQPAHIGKPGERLHASRFLGDKGYLVTFRQTDPLYVIDFSNPENPSITGELVIEGFSDYLHPVGENHLLGLGRGAVADTNGFGDGRGAFATGIKVSLFDVSNPASPFEVQSLELGLRGSNAEALFDHHGVTFRPGTDGQPGRLAFGVDINDIPSGDNFSPVPFYNWRETGLHTFEVHTGDNPGLNLVGKLIVESATPQNPWGPQAFGDRSLFVDDAVFYIHGDQVYGAQWGSVESFNGPR